MLKRLCSLVAQHENALRVGMQGYRVQLLVSRSNASSAVTGIFPWRPPGAQKKDLRVDLCNSSFHLTVSEINKHVGGLETN